jgi:uncharacterized protein
MDSYLDSTQKRRLYNSVLVVVILLAAFLAAKTLNEIKENSYIGRGIYAANVISVSGTGEVFAVPDVGSFYFSVVEEGKTVKDAQDKATKKVNDIISALKGQGIEEKDIKTTNYNSYPKYEYLSPAVCTNGYCPPGKQNLIGYEVNQTISVKVRKTSEAGNILTKVGDLGATNISGLDFVIDDTDTVQAQARDKAVADAKAKAKVLAKSLGIKLGRVVNFSESGSYPGPIYYSRDVAGKGGATLENQAVPPQVPTGENKIVSNVNITYEVE